MPSIPHEPENSRTTNENTTSNQLKLAGAWELLIPEMVMLLTYNYPDSWHNPQPLTPPYSPSPVYYSIPPPPHSYVVCYCEYTQPNYTFYNYQKYIELRKLIGHNIMQGIGQRPTNMDNTLLSVYTTIMLYIFYTNSAHESNDWKPTADVAEIVYLLWFIYHMDIYWWKILCVKPFKLQKSL